MDLSALLGFVSIAGWILVIGGAALAINNASQNRQARPGLVLAGIGLVVGILFFIISSGLVLVSPTEVAVVFQSVGGDPSTNSLWARPLGPGVHVVVPVVNVPIKYSTETRNYTMSKTANEGGVAGDDSVQVRTRDGQQVYIDISVLYSIDPVKANLVHIRYQNRFEADFIRPTVRAAVRDVVSGYNVEDLYGEKRTEIQIKTHDSVAPKFPENGLVLKDLLLRNITFSDEFIKAVEQKQVAQQQAEQAKQEAERARTIAKGQADAAVTSAKGEAEANVARASGEAQAIELRAAADAKALSLINEQISKNPALVQWRYIEKLAQNVSLILIPNNSPFLFDPATLANQAGNNVLKPGNTQPTPQPTANP
jgi:regulator of protease activity HflC (stomatin/prohibitin superfamily)